MGYGIGQMKARNNAAASVEARVRPTTLATIAKWMIEEGRRPRTKSELVREALEVLEELLVAAERVEKVEWTEDAMEFLESIGLDKLNRNQRGSRALAQTLQREEEIRERLAIGLWEEGESKGAESSDIRPRMENGRIYTSVLQELLDLGYEPEDDRGTGLSEEIMKMLRAGKMPERRSNEKSIESM